MDEVNIYSPPAADLDLPQGNHLASRWARLGGSLVDGVISVIILGPVMFYTGFWERAMSDNLSISDTILYGLLGLAIYLVLNGYLLSKHGQTIGKLLLGTRIVSVDTNEILPLWKAFCLRYLPLAVSANLPIVGPFIVMIDSLFVFRKNKRCLHDLIAGTKVVRADAH